MISPEAYIRRETLLSVGINATISLILFLIVFGVANPVEVWGVGKFAFDFLPQAFMIALMSTLVPGVLTERKIRQGKLQTIDGRSRLPKALSLRAILIATTAGLVSASAFAGVFLLSGLTVLGWSAALALKLAFGAGLAVVVTPIGLRAAMMKSSS